MTQPVMSLEELAEQVAALQAAKSASDQRIAELEAEKAAREAEGWEPKVARQVRHWLHLANGNVVDLEGAVPTHVAMEDGTVVPVTAAYAQQ